MRTSFRAYPCFTRSKWSLSCDPTSISCDSSSVLCRWARSSIAIRSRSFNDFSRSLVLTLYVIAPSTQFVIPSLVTQWQSRSQRLSWVPTVDQIEWGISPYTIMCRVDGGASTSRRIHPNLSIGIPDIHLQSSRQCLHHSFCCPIRLRSVRHGCTLFLLRDPIERSEDIGHESRLSTVADRFTDLKSSKHTLFITLSDRLCSSGGTRLSDHVP